MFPASYLISKKNYSMIMAVGDGAYPCPRWICRPWILVVSWLTVACITSSSTSTAEGKIRHFKWEVKYEFRSPDCFNKPVMTINGMSPGPTIVAEEGDTIVVVVKNSLGTENLVVHWHGIEQRGIPWFDGTQGVSQCPISPGHTFTYTVVFNKAGTFMYHAHYGMQRTAGLNGMIHVHLPPGKKEPFSYDFDRSILLTDWYHKSTSELAIGLSSIPFGWVGEPQSLLVQGRGCFNCSLVNASTSDTAGTCNPKNPECSPFSLTVIPGKTYRLRLGSLTSLSALSFEIEGHTMTVVEADGYYVEPIEVKNLFIYSGETYSVLIKANQDSSRNYWITTNVVSRRPATSTGLAILNYYPNPRLRKPTTIPTTGPLWNDTVIRVAQSRSIKARKGLLEPPPLISGKTFLFLNTQNKINGYIRWSVNNVSISFPTIPYLVALKENLLQDFDQNPISQNYSNEYYKNYDIYSVANNVNATESNAIYRLKFNSVVDVILQNANTMTPNNSETHPWHLHGHHFWVLGYGTGKFNLARDKKNYNLIDPIKKNTVPLHPYGWTALRFLANNPGVWLFHCHIESHMYLGMSVVFEEGIDKVANLPKSIVSTCPSN